MFELHPRLQADCLNLGRFELCRLLLMNERRYPWLILVPERPCITEIYELNEADQRQLLQESSRLALAMSAAFRPDKLNIASIGNLVPQLHIHHVARYRNDPAWPAAVWGKFDPLPYDAKDLGGVTARLKSSLADPFMWSLP